MKKIHFTSYVIYTCCLFVMSLSFTPPATGQDSKKEVFYIGTGTKNVYVLAFERSTGAMEILQTVEGKDRPTFLDVHPRGTNLAVVCREGVAQMPQWGSAASYAIDPKTGKISLINEQPTYAQGPCHVSYYPSGKWIFISHYNDGLISILPVTEDGKLGASSERLQLTGSSVDPVRQTGPHTHSATPSRDGSFLYVCDLGIDKVMIYRFNNGNGTIVPAEMPWAQVPGGSGPRHFTLHKNGELAFLAEEISSTVHAFKVNPNDGSLQSYYRRSTLPPTYKDPNKVADIHLHPNGNFLYVSNRGHNSIAIFDVIPATGAVKFRKTVPTGGNTPRNFFIDPQGQFALVANKDSNTINYFKLDASGDLIATDQSIEIPDPMCIKYLAIGR